MMDLCLVFLVTSLLLVLCSAQEPAENWEDAWSYYGLTGPAYWGQLHSTWNLCGDGNMQSPINLESERLVYDRYLRRLDFTHTQGGQISGNYTNNGKAAVFLPVPSDREDAFSVSGGPLHYTYILRELRIHFGQNDVEGSEHLIERNSFQGEVQLTFWNSDLYTDYERALKSPRGLVIVSIFLQIGNKTSDMKSELAKLTHSAVIDHIAYKDTSMNITNLNVLRLLPDTMEYITYEGSMTRPPCYETVTWVLLNRPIHISTYELVGLRELLKTKFGDRAHRTISRNIRPTHRKGSRAIRTNIAHVDNLDEKCYQNRVEHTYTATVLG